MTNNARTVAVIKGQGAKFSGIIIAKERALQSEAAVDKGDAVRDTGIKGHQALEHCPRAQRAHPAHQDGRLSRNLDDEDFTEEMHDQTCPLGSAKVLDDMVIAIDPGDLRKWHEARMECVCTIHDGSEHELGKGYWLAKAVAADLEHKTVIPLYLEAYSQEVRGFKSENDQLFKVIDTVGAYRYERY